MREWGRDLYLIQSSCTGAFKVGRSSDPKRRLHDLQVGSPFELRLILVLEKQGHRERAVHRALRGYHSQGVHKGEWFIEPGLASLPMDIYAQLDLELISTWWETGAGPIHKPGPVQGGGTPKSRHTPLV